jgi:hypothetical protein
MGKRDDWKTLRQQARADKESVRKANLRDTLPRDMAESDFDDFVDFVDSGA